MVTRTFAGSDFVSVSNVYLALVPMDQPLDRPAVEVIADGRVTWRDVAPGQYILVADAPAFNPLLRPVRITSGTREQRTLDLTPEFEMTGTVADADGLPIAGATISHPRIVPPQMLAGMSQLSRRNGIRSGQTNTDANGWWRLPVMDRGYALLVEAHGYRPEWVTWKSGSTEPLNAVLRKGASLRVTTDHAAPEVILTLIPTAHLDTSIPVEWQRRVWAREVATTVVDWQSLPPGKYDLVASWPDPLRFAPHVTLVHESIDDTGEKEIHVKLPLSPPVTTSKYVRMVVPGLTDVKDLHAFIRVDGGVKPTQASDEVALAGPVLYANGTARGEDVLFTTADDVIVPGLAKGEFATAVEGTHFPKADGALRVSVPHGARLPPHGNARFDKCPRDETYVLPVNVAKNGEIALPLLVGCRALTLRFEDFAPVVLASLARKREQVWLGTHRLKAAASAEIHVVQEPIGTDVANAIVTANVDRDAVGPLQTAKRIAGNDGRVVISGLPVGEEITFRAVDESTDNSGSVSMVLKPGQHAVIDPLPLPDPASLTVIPSIDGSFRAENPDVAIVGLVVERQKAQEAEKVAERRSVDLTPGQGQAILRGMHPGSWRILVMVRLAGVTQPVDVDTVTLKSGDKKEIRPVVRPLALSGRVTLRGQGVFAQLAFTDPPGAGATIRYAQSKNDGSFRIMLPRPGVYTVAARHTPMQPPTDLGPIKFDESSGEVQLALPEGSLSVEVYSGSGALPASDVQVTATMLTGGVDGSFYRLERKDRTNLNGEVKLDELQDGTWLVNARAANGDVAEKTVAVASAHPASVTLNLGGSVLEGVVIDSLGAPAGSAAVDCIYSGSDNLPRMVRADTDSSGRFSIPIASPAPDRLQCGVTSLDGAIGTFTTTPTSDASFVLPLSTSALTLTQWSDFRGHDRYWLVAADGGIFDISWAARKLRRMEGPFTIPKLPAGAWSVVRVDSPAAFYALALGGAAYLPQLASIHAAPGKTEQIAIQGDGTSNHP